MEFYEKVLGTLVGQAVGDAMGFPFEGWQKKDIIPYIDKLEKEFVVHPSGVYQPGQYTDDTQMMRAIFESIVESNGLDMDDIATRFMTLWQDNQIVGQGMACRESILRLISNQTSWMDSGAEQGRAGNGAAMRVAPIGILNYKTPENLPWDAIITSRITHKDSRACAGAVIIASAIAYNLRTKLFNQSELIQILVQSTEPINVEFAGYIKKLPELLEMDDEKAVYQIANMGLDSSLGVKFHTITPFVIPSVIISLWSFLKSPNDYMETVTRVILVGGDVDTTAAMSGALCGSLNGIEAIPANLASSINDKGEFGYDYLDKLVNIYLQNNMER